MMTMVCAQDPRGKIPKTCLIMFYAFLIAAFGASCNPEGRKVNPAPPVPAKKSENTSSDKSGNGAGLKNGGPGAGPSATTQGNGDPVPDITALGKPISPAPGPSPGGSPPNGVSNGGSGSCAKGSTAPGCTTGSAGGAPASGATSPSGPTAAGGGNSGTGNAPGGAQPSVTKLTVTTIYSGVCTEFDSTTLDCKTR